MPYCSRCGVEVDHQVDICPLCEAPIQKLPPDDGSPWPSDEAPAPQVASRSPDERLALARIITTMGFLIPVFIVLAVDLFVSRSLGWSLFVTASLGAAWLWAILPLILTRHPFYLTGAMTLVAVVLEWGLGLMAGNVSWILTVGMPVIITAGGLASLVILFSRASARLGGNLAGWILLALALLCGLVDILTSARYSDSWIPGWSLIVAGTLIPVAVLLLVLHYRPSQRTRMRRYFHV